MEHLPKEALAALLEEARKRVVVGARYAHYKHPEAPYLVKGLAIDEGSQEVVVIYEETEGKKLAFTRPLQSFVEEIPHESKRVLRFVKLDF